MVAHDLDGRIIFANDAFCKQQGIAPEDLKTLEPYGWTAVSDVGIRSEIVDRITTVGHYFFDVAPPPGVEGRGRWRVESWLVHTGSGSAVVSVRRDVSELHRTAEALDFRSMLLDQVSDAVICHRLDGEIVYVNDAACLERGFTREQLLGKRIQEITSGTAAGRYEAFADEIAREGSASFESEDLTADGRSMTVEVHARLVEFDGEPVVVSVVRDITERKREHQAVERMAFHDILTGLPNRRVLMDRLKAALADAAATGEFVAVAFIDLDYLKEINDRFGHAFGDRVLEIAGVRLSGIVRKGDIVARFGGDEFVIALPALPTAEAADSIGQKLLATFRDPFDIDGVRVVSTASIGIAVSGAPDVDASRLVSNADTAMYHVKADNRNAYAVYTPAMHAASDRDESARSERAGSGEDDR